MNKKICPVCDHPVGAMNYCKICKTFVRRPAIINVDYYLNEGHPKDETKCSYHKPEPEIFHEMPRLRRESFRPVGERKTTATQARLVVYLAVTAVVITGAAVSVIRDMNESAKQQDIGLPEQILKDITLDLDDSENYGMTIEEYNQPEQDVFQNLDENEVIREGKSCSGLTHFSADGRELAKEMEETLISMGYAIESVEHDSYNVQQGGETYFETSVIFTAESSGEGKTETMPQLIIVGYDTGSGQVHNLVTMLSDWELTKAALKIFVNKIEDDYGISEEDGNAAQILSAVDALPQHSGFFYDTINIFDISCDYDGNSLFVEIKKSK